MIFVSFPTAELSEPPAAAMERLRANWVNSGVYVILEGVTLQTFDENGQPVPDTHEEHLLVGFDGDASLAYELPRLLASWGLPPPLLWDERNVHEAVEYATAFYTESGINWERMYAALDVTQMHWYWDALDPDLEEALDHLGLQTGTFLDLGTGPGTQAIALAKKGFNVTATDISDAAIDKAQERAIAEGADVRFLADDILGSGLAESFDYAVDRGLLHAIPPESRGIYVQAVASLVRPGGILFLKTFSARETDWGPYKFTPQEVSEMFAGPFRLESSKETVMQGTRTPLPLALFSVLSRVAAAEPE